MWGDDEKQTVWHDNNAAGDDARVHPNVNLWQGPVPGHWLYRIDLQAAPSLLIMRPPQGAWAALLSVYERLSAYDGHPGPIATCYCDWDALGYPTGCSGLITFTGEDVYCDNCQRCGYCDLCHLHGCECVDRSSADGAAVGGTTSGSGGAGAGSGADAAQEGPRAGTGSGVAASGAGADASGGGAGAAQEGPSAGQEGPSKKRKVDA